MLADLRSSRSHPHAIQPGPKASMNSGWLLGLDRKVPMVCMELFSRRHKAQYMTSRRSVPQPKLRKETRLRRIDFVYGTLRTCSAASARKERESKIGVGEPKLAAIRRNEKGIPNWLHVLEGCQNNVNAKLDSGQRQRIPQRKLSSYQ